MKFKFLGSGDAFGTGGRFNTCFHIARERGGLLIDCGASSLVAMGHFGVHPNSIDTIIISHGHGDHFGGLAFLLRALRLVHQRDRLLTIAGPVGIGKRIDDSLEAAFPGAVAHGTKFPVKIVELEVGVATRLDDGLSVSAFEAVHPSGTPTLSLRVTCDGRVISYTGDTEWTDALVDVGRDADLLICECFWTQPRHRYHLDLQTLREKLPRISAKQVVLTHMSEEMLTIADDIPETTAFDGMEIEL
ncbi:MBL fold metallo-hydrolase [Bradyrhizobium sp. SYSU BS000235]|uniref:MBL fold metallo-hydrolase n=1 Tax=Bradyrhizobium sp. SYSU BS000235 TaxID=3411332 RepID=UPI003C75BF7D